MGEGARRRESRSTADETGGTEVRQRTPTHRCKVCGCKWILWPADKDGESWWSLGTNEKCGPCCDNVAMGDQIETLAEAYDRAANGRGDYTLRDRFAMAALAGMLACGHRNYGTIDDVLSYASRVAYEYADAMLAEREKEPQ